MASRILSESRNDDEDEVTLVFVVPLNLEQQDCNDDMREAYSRCSEQEAGLEPSWKSEEDCLRMKPTKRHVFVLQEFKGPAFDYLQDFKCVICGPRCLIHCLMLNDTMPNVNHPVFTAAMKDLVVTCSGGGHDVKKLVKEKVELMGGTFVKTFNGRTTHVVVQTVSSSKYEKALELGIPVKTVNWVESVWERSLKEYIKATDASFDVFKCPPFLNLKVCSSGFIIKETERIKNTVNKYGGIYSSSLSCNINILVVKNPKGDKFKFAKSWSIPCVENRWIYDSVLSGHALPTKAYEVEGRAASSPTRDGLEAVSFSANVSNILFDQRSQIEETMMNSSTISTASYCPVNKPSTPSKMPPPAAKKTPMKTPVKTTSQTIIAPGKLKHLLHELDVSQTKKAGAFLDGCGVYLVGWTTEEEEILKKILKCSGAARFSDLSDQVSHILVGNLEKTFLRTLKTLHHKPHVVNIKWLIQSVADKHPAPEEPCTCLPRDDLNVSEAPSPLSKKGMALLQRENFSPQKSSPLKQANHEEESGNSNGGNVLLAKYISSDMPNRSTMSTSAIDMPPPPVPSFKQKFAHIGVSNLNANDSDMVSSQGDYLFSGLKFIIVGLSEKATEYVEELICKHGGEVAKKSFKGVPDYAVVPLTHASLLQTACEIVNSLWIESCIEEDRIVQVEYYHQPVVLDESKRPLEGCVLGLSGYSGKERQFIMELATSMGAICQDVFAKKSKSDAKASSHLICKTNDKTEKFNAAIKWGRPAMYHSWLLACAASGTLAPEVKHLVDPSQVIKPLEINNSTTSSISDITSMQTKVESAQVAALRKLPCFKTPERTPILYDQAQVEKILNYKPSPNPHAVATPPVPIGISENPTPEESKRIQKWLNKLPEKIPSPPPRRDSTPLHELRRRVIEAHSVTTPEMLHLVPIKSGGIPLDENSESPNVEKKDTSLRSSPKQRDQGISCSTPTSGLATTSRKLFDNVETESPIDGQLEKLKKLIAAPNIEESGSSSKIVTRPHPKFIEQSEKHVMYDALRQGSQPYTIKWEDPVNVKRSAKEDMKEENEAVLVSSNKNIIPESSSKRKSSENAESPPNVKKPSLENAHSVGKQPSKVYKISFSSVGEKGLYHNIIKELGGVVIDSSTYSKEATHLILERAPQRSEKLLAFIAAGKWILHISFLRESQKQNKFVKEEDFEWGNPQNKSLSKVKLNDVEDALARAAHRWRSLIASERSKGAFENFCCKVYANDHGKASAFERLISAGGGQVLPERSSERPSFCLVHASRRDVIVECAKLGILCVPLTFLFDHLTIDPSPDPQSRAMNEYISLRKQFSS